MNNKYLLGLVSVSFRKNSPEEILKASKEAGLSFIEWGSDVHAPCNEIDKLKRISAMQKEYQIECSSYGTYFRFGESDISELENYIAAAKILGTNILRLWCGTKSGKDMTKIEMEELMSQCRRAAEIAERHDVTLCMECHRKTFTENSEDTLMLMKRVNSRHFRMYWQPFQWLEPSESLKIAKAIAPYTEHIHVFNWRGDKKLPLIEAVDEWRQYLSLFDTPRTLLLEFMPDGRIESLQNEVSTLRTIIGDNR